MIRSQLVQRLTAQNPHLYERDYQAAVDAILDRISDAIAAGDRVVMLRVRGLHHRGARGKDGAQPTVR